jgi:thymidylate kinase
LQLGPLSPCLLGVRPGRPALPPLIRQVRGLSQMAPAKAAVKPGDRRPFVLTFSGIDGAGKTTQIEYLSSFLQKQGLRVVRLSFWDDVAFLSKFRAGVGQHTADLRSNSMPQSSSRNNKHIRKWYLTAARAGFYFLDVARLHFILAGQLVKNADVVIFDRYIYDQIANIYSKSLAARLYARLLLKCTPAPGVAFVIDALPDEAFARKPEYPLEFVYQNRRNFLRLRAFASQLVVIAPGNESQVRSAILFHIGEERLLRRPPKTEVETDLARGIPVDAQQSSCRVPKWLN